MLLREIFNNDEDTDVISQTDSLDLILNNQGAASSLRKPMFYSVLLHAILFTLFYLVATLLTYILMLLGINLDLFKKPELKIRDIDFVFVLPEKYDIKNSFLKNAQGNNYSLAGPNPDNRPYNGDEGSLKSDLKDNSKAKDSIVNKKPLKNTDLAASQTTIPLSKKAKKGSYIPKVAEPGVFTANIPDAEMNSDLGWGKQGKSGYHSPTAGNASFKSGGEGAGGSGTGDSVGKGNVKGGGYYYGSAGAPRPQTANAYKNEGLDIDLRPYTTELQRKVLRNWAVPNRDNNKKTVLFLRIGKTGNLMILNIKTPSGDTYIDELAVSAVKKAQPFAPLPTGYRNSYADIILTFDYNISARAN